MDQFNAITDRASELAESVAAPRSALDTSQENPLTAALEEPMPAIAENEADDENAEVSAAATAEKQPLLPFISGKNMPKLLDDPPADTPKVGRARFGVRAFIEDAQDMEGGTIPSSIVVGFTIGIICGVVAFVYYTILEAALEFTWKTVPESLAESLGSFWPEWMHWTWIPIIGFPMAVLVGASVNVFGEPGDLAYTVKMVHRKAYIDTDHILPMLFASQFSIIGGGSLGPEAPLVAICASTGGWVSRVLFKQKYKNVVRKHTLCGMACALAAFFGVPLGGSLFALEVNSRLGYEYYEHALEAVLSGTVCLIVFRGLAGLPIGPIWTITAGTLGPSAPGTVALGAAIGLMGAFMAFLFAEVHLRIMKFLTEKGIIPRPIYRALFGSIGIVVLGCLFPQTMFWGEFEFQTISSGSPASTLEHIWPTSGAIGFEITNFFSAVVVGCAKLLAISFTVSGGYRGGFIFPFFAAGASFGRALVYLFPSVSPVVACLCFAAGINVSITRTALATTLILCALAGEINAGPPVLAAALCALFATAYMPFIKTQQSREDADESQIYSYTAASGAQTI